MSPRRTARPRRGWTPTTTRGPATSGRIGPASLSAPRASSRRPAEVRALDRAPFLAGPTASPEILDRLIEVGTIRPLPDGRFDARDEFVLSVAMAMLGAGIALDDLGWALDN